MDPMDLEPNDGGSPGRNDGHARPEGVRSGKRRRSRKRGKRMSPRDGDSLGDDGSFVEEGRGDRPKDGTSPVETKIPGIVRIDENRVRIEKGLVRDMNTSACAFVNESLFRALKSEFDKSQGPGGGGGFLPAMKQLANVAALPGIVGESIGLPDMHSGYGFAIGNVAAFDLRKNEAVISPGGVGFDINCGVRLIKSNLSFEDVNPQIGGLCDHLERLIPVGVGASADRTLDSRELEEVLETGIDWALKEGIGWPEDKVLCEENGRMPQAEARAVSQKAKSRGRSQIGTLGSGNHYVEVQYVETVYDEPAARVMGLFKGQVVVMIHTGSRGLGHQVATDSLREMEKMEREGRATRVNDRQLACARVNSPEGQKYLRGMSAAANFAWVNRQMITHRVRQAFENQFGRSSRDLGMSLVYDVCHNVAKIEKHIVDGTELELIVHRKGATRAFPPHHTAIPEAYREIGQPVLIGGSMGTFSYVLVGTEEGKGLSFSSTCHGAGRVASRSAARKNIESNALLSQLEGRGITIRAKNKRLLAEEAPDAYKDVDEVVNVCHNAGLSKKVARLRPISVVKG